MHALESEAGNKDKVRPSKGSSETIAELERSTTLAFWTARRKQNLHSAASAERFQYQAPIPGRRSRRYAAMDDRRRHACNSAQERRSERTASNCAWATIL
eukprot:754755-Hanusia_phi.AAC.2